MSTMNAIASAFWPVIDDQDVADVTFGHVGRFVHCERNAAASPAVAGRYYKGSLGHVNEIVANPHTDGDVLRRFAKDTRVSVRHELLTNPSTPSDVVADLLVWAIGRRDRLPEQALARLSLAEIAAVLQRAGTVERADTMRCCDADFAVLAERCTAEPEHAVALARAGVQGLSVALARAAHAGVLGDVSLTAIVDADPESIEAILVALLGDRSSLTVELATLWKTWRDDPDTRTYRHFGFSHETYASVEAGAANVLTAGDISQLVTAMVNGADDDLLTARAAEASVEELTAMVDALKYRTVSARCEAAIATRLTWLSRATSLRLSANRVLEVCKSPLPEEVLLNLLRTGSPNITIWWLRNADLPCGPRKGMLTALYANPGRAFGADHDADSSERGQIRLSAITAGVERPELVDELIELHDGWIGENLHMGTVAAVVYPTLRKTFAGAQLRAAWETFLTLAADWSDSFTQLLTTVTELNGIDTVAETARLLDKAGQPACSVQLTLL